MLMPFYTKTIRETLDELATLETGLPQSEAEDRLRQYGLNTIKVSGQPLWRKIAEPFANVFMIVLFVAAAVSLMHNAVFDAAIIGTIIAISAVIYYVQAFSTERILRALQKHHAQTVEVLRNNKITQLDASLLVPGDIILLAEGEKVPADARILSTNLLRVDEAQLTGESLPVVKQTDTLHEGLEIYEQKNMVFQGSFVTQGEAIVIVVATGNDTEFGQLAALATSENDKSPIQKKIDVLVTRIIAVVAAMAIIAFGLSSLRGMELSESIRFVIALSVSAVPESLPVAISVILVLGMRRMAAKKALVRSMRAIETIGAITTIATDKTGTLTKNKLTVQATWQPSFSLRQLTILLRDAINYRSQKMHDPLDTALHSFIISKNVATSKSAPLTAFPFDPKLAMSGNLWHHGDGYYLAIKGAPEHVLLRSDLTENEHEAATVQLHKMTEGGFRVIAVAFY
jgi:Ca2+-transporting ATPase